MYVVYSICLYFFLSIVLFTYNKNHLSKKKVVQYHVYFPFSHDNTVKIKILGKKKLLSYSGHLDKKNDVLHHMFQYLIPLIWMI